VLISGIIHDRPVPYNIAECEESLGLQDLLYVQALANGSIRLQI